MARSKRRAPTPRRVDANQGEIVGILRAMGCSVEPRLAQLGGGIPDLLVGMNNRNYVIEVKDENQPPSKQKLSDDEEAWHKEWRGQKAVINSVAGAVAWVNEMRRNDGHT